jgi:hypothetical protein
VAAAFDAGEICASIWRAIMTNLRLIACVAVLILAVGSSEGQTGSDTLKQELEGIRATARLLEQPVQTVGLQDKMALADFLEILERRVAATGKIMLRIDGDAFGDKRKEIARTPVSLPPVPKRMSLGTALRLALSQLPVSCEYRIGPSGVTITAPGRPGAPLHTATYDIRHLTETSRLQKAARIVQTLIAQCDRLPGMEAGAEEPTMQVLNGTKFVVRASALGHYEVGNALDALRRIADLSVIVQAQLHEVDDAFYTRLKKVKRVPLEELERRFLEGEAPKDDLFKILKTQKLMQAGEESKVQDGAEVLLLSRHAVIACLPTPEQVRKDLMPWSQPDSTQQTILQGVSFIGRIHVSPDRRSVRVKLSEKSAQVEEIHKVKVSPRGFSHRIVDGLTAEGKLEQKLLPPEQKDAEIAYVKESVHTRVLEIPDGGSILVAVNYRPSSLAAKNRWWVLSITPRIFIEEEERQIRQGALDSILPALVADVLNNPRLKTTREFYGSPGDKRVALLKNDALDLAWPEKIAVPGFEVTKAERAGKRLLGIRLDGFQGPDEKDASTITITLLNAGGSENGAVIGSCTIRYTARAMEKGYAVGLAE